MNIQDVVKKFMGKKITKEGNSKFWGTDDLHEHCLVAFKDWKPFTVITKGSFVNNKKEVQESCYVVLQVPGFQTLFQPFEGNLKECEKECEDLNQRIQASLINYIDSIDPNARSGKVVPVAPSNITHKPKLPDFVLGGETFEHKPNKSNSPSTFRLICSTHPRADEKKLIEFQEEIQMVKPASPPNSGFILVVDGDGDIVENYPENSVIDVIFRRMELLDKEFPSDSPHSAWRWVTGGFTQVFDKVGKDPK